MIGLRFYPLVSAGGLHDEPKERLRGKAKTDVVLFVVLFVSSGVSIVQCHLRLFNLSYY